MVERAVEKQRLTRENQALRVALGNRNPGLMHAGSKMRDIVHAAEQASYDWPGNVRELENAVEHAVVFTKARFVPMSALPHVMPVFSQTRHSLKFRIGMPWKELACCS